MKYPYSCFSFHFLFSKLFMLILLLLVVVISLSFLFVSHIIIFSFFAGFSNHCKLLVFFYYSPKVSRNVVGRTISIHSPFFNYVRLYHFTQLRVFHTSVSGWFSLESEIQQVSSSLPKSPGLFSVFWPISTMMYFG